MDSYALVLILGALSLLFLFLRRQSSSGSRRRAKLPPGPRPLPIIGNLHILGTLPHRTLHTLARKYGPIMSLRLGNIPTVVISSPEAAELFLKTHDAVFASRPRIQALEYISYGNKSCVFAPYGPYWRSARRLCTVELLSPARVESFAPMRREEVGRLVENINEAATAREVVDVSVKVGEVIGDIACKMILGCATRDIFNLRPIMQEIFHLVGAFNLADYVPILAPLDLQGFTKRLNAARDSIDAMLEDIINTHERNSGPENNGSFLDILMSMINQPMNSNDEITYIMERTNIKALLLDLIAASYESSSTTIDWALSELARNPRVMSRLQEELETVVGMDRMVEEADLPKLSYLEMVVKESFRLHPAAPLLAPHESTKDIEIMGDFIPRKSRIIINAWSLGRDPKIWSENAEEFFPERFTDSNIDLKGQNFQLVPFGSGRRGCPGMNAGLTIVRLIIAQLVHCFKWEMPDGQFPSDLDMTEEFGLALPRANHLLLRPTYRLLY